MLEHGGGLRQAAKTYAIPLSEWLDLSTGINPCGWQVPAIPVHAWARLPESGDGLEAAAQCYYQVKSLLPVSGSQAAIQMLPMLRQPGRAGVIAPTYAEHAYAWRRAGHDVLEVSPHNVDTLLDSLDTLLVVNPNNPDGKIFTPQTLLAWHQCLSDKNGWLVVDEAYMDATSRLSVAPYTDQRPGLIVLRSLGKFFGLAGARVGFVLAEAALLEMLNEALGPWSINGPARFVAQQALSDHAWQSMTRSRLEHDTQRLAHLLQLPEATQRGGCALFQWLATARAADIQRSLAEQGILVRLFQHPASLRFGLPGNENDWQRLAAAWRKIVDLHDTQTIRDGGHSESIR